MEDKNIASQEELIKFLAYKLDISEALVKRFVQELINFIVLSLLKGCPLVNIQRFGTFKLQDNKPQFSTNFENLDKTDKPILDEIDKTIVFQANPILTGILEYYHNSLKQEEALKTESIKDIIERLNYFKNRSKTEVENKNEVEEYQGVGSKINTNKPDTIRTSFINYLRHEYPYKESWTHPITKTVYPFKLIQASLEAYKELNRESYRALWALWTSQQSRAFIAEHFNYSSSSLKRKWNKAIDTVLLIMYFPGVHPTVPLNLYEVKLIEQ